MLSGPNRMRRKLTEDGYATGTMVFSWSPAVLEAAGLSGIDFVRIDSEHAWRQDAILEHLARAAALVGVTLMVRVDNGNLPLVRKALEVGAQAVLVANVISVAEAQAIVQAARFPPGGTRSFTNYCWSAKWNTVAAAEWIRWSNSEPMIGIMIEDARALDAIDDIVAVDGIDFVNFGPADFSLSIGLEAPARDHPRVRQALLRVMEAARKSGKHVMCNVAASTLAIRQHLDIGLTILELGNDLDCVRLALSEAVRTASNRRNG